MNKTQLAYSSIFSFERPICQIRVSWFARLGHLQQWFSPNLVC